jgi:excisionase family DNA binding protein
MDKKFYTVQEVADMFGFKARTIRDLITDGLLEAVKFRTEYRITPQQIENYIKENTTKGQTKIISAEEDPTSNEKFSSASSKFLE